jgi:ABC-2 type transport system ATP-binding protein
MTGLAVTTSKLSKDYGRTGLFGVDLAVPAGAIYGLVGPNGAGKTTLLSLLTGLRRPDSGTITISVGQHRIAYCPDVSEFDGWLTATEVVELALALARNSASQARASRNTASQAGASEAAGAALASAGLADAADRRVGGFSRGMTARLGLACALVADPELLILDEPASALDPAGRAELLGTVAGMRGSRTVIFSSHILADVQRVADQVGILREGRLLYQGSTQHLIETYLRPCWLVRIADDPAGFAERAALEPWVSVAEPAGDGAIRIEATNVEAGERGIPALVASFGARLAAMEPAGADLESAFLALTAGPRASASGATAG